MGIIVIEKQDLKHNIKQIKEYAKRVNDKLKIIAIVKSNGYGLGLEEYANFLIDNGIDYLAVASTDEAIKLREAGIKEDILMMSSTAIEQELEDMVKEVNATQVAPEDLLSDKVQYYDRAAKTLGRKQEKGLLERLSENKAQVQEREAKAPKERQKTKQEPSL